MVTSTKNFVNSFGQKVQLRIHGQVQGVFYRTKAREKARELGLVGLARNEPDGTVFILAEGPRQVLKKFIKRCYDGPKGAKVERIDTRWGEANGKDDDFKIIYRTQI